MKHWFWVDVYFVTPRMGSLPGPSVHGILQARIQEWVAIPFCRESIFPTQALSPGLLHCRKILYRVSRQGSPMCQLAMGPAKDQREGTMDIEG